MVPLLPLQILGIGCVTPELGGTQEMIISGMSEVMGLSEQKRVMFEKIGLLLTPIHRPGITMPAYFLFTYAPSLAGKGSRVGHRHSVLKVTHLCMICAHPSNTLADDRTDSLLTSGCLRHVLGPQGDQQ
jgi:hypothetical protein